MSRIASLSSFESSEFRFSHRLAAALCLSRIHVAGIWLAGLLLLLPAGVRAQSVFPATNVGSPSAEQGVTVTSASGGTVKTVKVLTMGQSGLDFAAGTGASTCPNATLGANGTCTEFVTFTPAAAGLRMGAVVLLDASNRVLGTTYLSGTGAGALGVLVSGNLLPVAGQDGLYSTLNDGKQATSAELYLPSSVTVDGAGNLYIADAQHHRIRMVCGAASTPTIQGTTCAGAGIISTIAGNGNPNNTGDGGAAGSATLNSPGGVALDGAGNLYIADTGNNEIRVISAATGTITAVAGNSAGTTCAGKTNSVGDSCPATQATLSQPWGVTLDSTGNVYIADTSNHRIREVSAATGLITTIAGNGFTASNGTGGYSGDGGLATAAELNFPYTVAFDPAGNMYIPDSVNQRVREVMASGGSITAASTIQTFAGNGTAGFSGNGAAANKAELYLPSGVAVDAAGNVYIADTQNAAIRKVSATTGFISTVAKNDTGNYYFNNNFIGIALYGPIGLFLDGNGNLYVADTLDMVVREMQGNFSALQYTTAIRQGSQSAPINLTVENDGNAPLNLASVTAGTNTALGTGTSCATGQPYLAVAGACTVAAVFAPASAGNPLTGDIKLADDAQPGPPEVAASNSPLDIKLVGNGLAVNSTTTAVTSALNPSSYGQTVTFTITVDTGSGTGNLTGTVSLADTFGGNTVTLASNLPITLNSAGTTGTATFSISTLAVGEHTIVASYSGDTGHFSSTSTDNGVLPLIQTVNENTTVTLISSANPASLGQNVAFTATVAVSSAGGGVAPDGTVTFSWGTTSQTVALNASGQAGYATSALPNGVTQITATYSGDAARQILGSQATLNQDVQVASSIGVTSSLNPSNYGNPVTFTATVTSTAAQPATGSVTFLDNGVSIGAGTLAGNPAIATLTTSSLTVGSHPITVSYAGDSYNAASVSVAPLVQTVNKTQTSTALAANPNPGIAGAPVSITATVQVVAGSATVTGSVTFTSGTTTLGSATLAAGGTATITPTLLPGSYPIVATYAGDANDQGSTSATFTLVVNQATTQTTVAASPNPALVGQSVTLTATVTGNGATPTGTVTFMAGTTTLGTGTLTGGTASFATSALAAGTYSITAVYGGDTNDAQSTSPAVSLTVGTIPTVTDLGSSTTGGTNPQVILVASVLNGATGPVPTGTVTFTSGTTTLGVAAVGAGGVAALVPNLTAGTNYTIIASYGGDASHSPSTSQPLTVSGTATGFSITVTPSTVSVASTQNTTVNVGLSSNGGFADTIGLGCASLPAGMTCHFSAISVALPANGTASAQLTIDTNNPLSGGTTAMNRSAGGGNYALAGIFLPLGAFFGLIFWRWRRRQASFLSLVLVLALSAGALLATGCNGISMGSVAPGTYTIEVTGTGANSNVIHYQNLTVTVTAK